MELILTFDVGTTAIKTSLFDKELTLIASRNDEYDLLTAQGYVELHPDTYWNTMVSAVKSLGQIADLKAVKAICLTTQGETMIPVDKSGKPLHNAVVWLDDRAKEQAKLIAETVSAEELYRLTGVTDMNGFVPLAKLLWFHQMQRSTYEKAYKFLLLEDYLLCRLTGRFVTEKSLLTSTGWYDIRNDRYWTELLSKLSLSEEKLPEILDCGTAVGTLTHNSAHELGLNPSVQVFTGAMDQIAAAIGGGGLRDGVVTATIGTAMVLTSAIFSMDDCSNSQLIIYRGIREGQYVLLPLCNTAGAVFKWYKDQCSALAAKQCAENNADVYDHLCEEAAKVPAGAEGVTLLPYFAGSMQPQLMPEAKGVFYGLGLTTDHKVMTRAVLESIGYMLRENLEMLESFGRKVESVHFFGGGSKNLVWNQIIADITGVRLVLPEQTECGSLGAAMLCAVSLGWYDTLSAAQARNTVRQIVTPVHNDAYDKAYDRYLKLFHAVKPMFDESKGE